MPDIGWMELLVIGMVALIVVGPKDLPEMFRKAGQVTGRIRGMAKEFTNAMNDAADQSGMKDINRDLRAMTNPKQFGLDSLKKSVNEAFEDIDPTKYPEGSEARKKAEKQAAAAQAAAEKRAAEDDRIRSAKLAAAKEADAAELQPEPELEMPAGAKPKAAKPKAAKAATAKPATAKPKAAKAKATKAKAKTPAANPASDTETT